MLLYTCPGGTSLGSTPIAQHPWGKAAKALDDGKAIAGSSEIAAWARANPA